MLTSIFAGYHRVIARQIEESLDRSDIEVFNEENRRIVVREVVDRRVPFCDSPSVLLIHDAWAPGSASLDLPTRGVSLADEIAFMGWTAYVVDVRGYGRSTRFTAIDNDPSLVRTAEAIVDIDAISWMVARRKNRRKISLLGWGVGGHLAEIYATLRPSRVSHLILIRSSYDGLPQLGFTERDASFRGPRASEQSEEPVSSAHRPDVAPALIPGRNPDVSIDENADIDAEIERSPF